jgi:hypothetical protein
MAAKDLVFSRVLLYLVLCKVKGSCQARTSLSLNKISRECSPYFSVLGILVESIQVLIFHSWYSE